MKKIYFILFLNLISFLGCVPKLEQVKDDSSSSYADKNLDRKIASENTKAIFNALDVQMNVRIGDREFIQNVFIDVFGPSADSIVKQFINNNGMALNGGCSQYEATYADNSTAGATSLIIDDIKSSCDYSVFNLPIVGIENSIREGLRIQACEKVVNDPTALVYLIDNVTGTSNVLATLNTIPTDLHITKIYNRFYPEKLIKPEVLESLRNISQSTTLTTAKDKFKLVALTVCMSADWQIP